MRAAVVAGLMLGSGLASTMGAQQESLTTPPAKPKQYVSYAAEEQVVKAGKKAVVELRFRVTDGFHVNSHTPKSELLIPTNLTLQPAAGVKAEAIEYPAGTEYSFSFEPKEKLDVYSGAFTVKLPVVAEAGSHTVSGVLRYQACDNAACYPPKSLPVEVVLTAK
ncbi:protein-disulfide reductase DsbD N-terminal domain-containing protein [Edaphobacter aggregans]|uniref:protein-disulfide reductase DsbD N-terminal domain-containing protein n=1 Tax=Edaphobacter aggregans TaxID=570835 RepID=UPI001FDF4DE7|nr:protein-disulfide reductase DsbD domain-containing protein [Edaphobacter aggregans]